MNDSIPPSSSAGLDRPAWNKGKLTGPKPPLRPGQRMWRLTSICPWPILKGTPFILSACLEDDRHAVLFDGLRKTDGPSALGDFKYQPVMFSAARRVRACDRRQLAMLAILLGRVQGAFPTGGIVYLGGDTTRTSIRFGKALQTADSLLRDAERLQRAESPPKLILNDHCRICAFHYRCHDQAIREDNLSLLRGIGEKAVKRYARKGVLTLTQLAHTFRPRRRGKRANTQLTRRDHALHALAISDRTVYVLGEPNLRRPRRCASTWIWKAILKTASFI